MSEKKFNPQLEYEKDEFTPGFVLASIITVVAMLAIIIAFVLIIGAGAIALSRV